jgi:glyoxylase-like metal-dependent hydrolase (beta-lactamase superfamily II)
MSRSWIEIPIHVFVIEHRDGLVLFDTGLDPAIASNPNYINSAIGRLFMKHVFRLHIGPTDTLAHKLNAIGYAASDVCKVVISHLHFDHIGGIGDVPQADLLVSRNEWRQLSQPHPERSYIFREHIELPGAKWMPLDFVATDDPLLEPFGSCYDVMGDGSIVLIPTPGHTVGSLSMLVRTDNYPPLLLIGDLAYDVDLLMRDQLPGIYANKAQLQSSFARVRGLKAQLPNLLILGSHDPAAVSALNSVTGSPTGKTNVKE